MCVIASEGLSSLIASSSPVSLSTAGVPMGGQQGRCGLDK